MSLREGAVSAPADPDLDDAIWRTLAYAGLFQYPLRLSELHRRLMDVRASERQIAARLAGPRLRRRIGRRRGFLTPLGCESWITRRAARAEHTARLLARHRRALAWITRFPFVRLLALSGACAHGNAADHDVDVFLVTRARRAWTVALLLMIVSKLAGWRRSLCVNYVLAEDGLALPEHDRFTAAEMVGLKPLAGRETYRRLIAANAWVAALYPNFFAAHTAYSEHVPKAVGAPRWERLLDGVAGVVEPLARAVLGAYLRRRLTGAGVALNRHRLKLHARDHRGPVSRAFDDLVEGARSQVSRPEARTA